jgi:hypothetical protein
MTNLDRLKLWNEYIETSRYVGRPLKLNAVLELRMKAFVKARELELDKIER